MGGLQLLLLQLQRNLQPLVSIHQCPLLLLDGEGIKVLGVLKLLRLGGDGVNLGLVARNVHLQ